MTTPTHEELLKLAEEAGFGTMERGAWFPLPARFAQIERFAALLSAHQAQGERARTRHFEVDPQSEKLAVARVRPSIGVTQPARHYIEALADIPAGTQIYIAQPPSAKTVLASPAAQSGAVDERKAFEAAMRAQTVSDDDIRKIAARFDTSTDLAQRWRFNDVVPFVREVLSRAQAAPAVSLSSVDLASDERALLQKAAQVISWHSFGECRAFGDGPIPEPSEVVGQIKEVLSRTAPQPVAEQVGEPDAYMLFDSSGQAFGYSPKSQPMKGLDWEPVYRAAHPQAAQAKESGDE